VMTGDIRGSNDGSRSESVLPVGFHLQHPCYTNIREQANDRRPRTWSLTRLMDAIPLFGS
jgi:hypothetical protein